jgi:hypothetical protein
LCADVEAAAAAGCADPRTALALERLLLRDCVTDEVTIAAERAVVTTAVLVETVAKDETTEDERTEDDDTTVDVVQLEDTGVELNAAELDHVVEEATDEDQVLLGAALDVVVAGLRKGTGQCSGSE